MAMKKFFVGVKAIIHDEKRGYLILKHARGYWDVPGGRIDDEEEFEETIRRELSEELPNVEFISLGELIDARRIHKDIGEGTGLTLLYFMVKARVPKDIQLSDEHSDYAWVDDINNLPNDGDVVVIDVLKKFL